MKSVRLLHIGDVHFPDKKREELMIDHQDSGLTPSWDDAFAPNIFKQISDGIRRLALEESTIRGVLLSGDLTSRGDMDEYQNCLEYMRDVLNLNDAQLWEEKKLHVVPGNHDVVRELADFNNANLFGKFEPIKTHWQAYAGQGLAIEDVGRSSISYNNCCIALFSINTCIGCGERRFLPEAVRDELHQLLKNSSNELPQEESFSLLGEQLDTPAILETHLSSLEEAIRCLDDNTVPVVLGHHGVLPQATPRLALYTELLNSGVARFRLSRLDRSVIYLHGHTHEDPVETVTTPAHRQGGLIVSSAPLFSEGFNVICMHYTNQGIPLGCEIIPHRLENYGSLRIRASVRIPLKNVSDARKVLTERTVSIVDSLDTVPKRFKDILDNSRQSLGSHIQINTLAGALLELEWVGLAEIDNREEPPKFWHVKRTGI